MAQTIKLKRSATAGAEPTTSQLELGEVAINTYDGKMYIKKSVAGTESIVEISGAGDTGIIDEFLYTATAGQTAFSGNDDNSDFLSYVTGAIQVFLNGILLDPETDYTATNGALLTLTSAASANDYLQIFSFKKKISDGNVTVDSFSGNNSTTAFTLSIDPGDENNTRVFVDGVYQSKANYTVSGTTLTFSTAPPSGTAIEVESGNRSVTLPTTENLDFPDNVKLRLGTSQDLEIYHDASDSLINDNGTGSLKLQTGGSTKLEVTSTGVDVTGNIGVSGTVDGVDIAARDAVLTSTTTTAGAALPRTGGAMTGAITTNSTFDGRDVATDGSKLDGIEAGATADQTQSEINALGITATGLSGTPAISVANITTTGELRGPASFTIDPAAVGDNTGTVIIKGNLQVDGATTTINSTTLTVDDLNLTLASGAANGTAADGAGITIDGASATLTYASAGDNWAFNKGLDVTGNLSIGGATPQGNLTIKGAASDDIDLLTFSEDGTNQSFSFNGNFAGSGSTGNNLTLDSYWTNDIMAWTGDGKVGIGTIGPNEALEVKGSIRIDNGSSFTAYQVYRDNILYGSVGGGNNQFTIQASNNKNINLFDDSGAGLTVKDGGNVGIGNTDPQHKIHFGEGGGYYTSIGSGNSTPGGATPWLGVFNNTSIASATYGWGFYDSNVDGSLQIWNKDSSTTGAVALTIKRGGNVGIGTDSPDAPLAIHNSDLTTTTFDGTGGIRVHRPNSFGQYGWFEYGYNSDTTFIGSKYSGGTAASYGQIWFAQDSNGGSRQYPLVINGSGNVGIGQTAFGVNGKLQVTGGISTTGNSEIRQSTNSDGSTLRFLGTQLVIANSNANGYSYSGGGLVASVSPLSGAITLDAGANSTSGHRLNLTNGGDGVQGSLNYKSGSNSRFSIDSSSGTIVAGNSTQATTLVRLDHENVGGKAELQLNAHGSASFSMLSNFTGSTVDGVATGNFGLVTPHNAGISINTSGLERMKIDGSGNTVFNEGGVDADFRVESTTNTHGLFVDASSNIVGVGLSSPTVVSSTAATSLNVGGIVSVEGILASHQTNKLILQRSGDVCAVRAYGAGAGDGIFDINVGGGGGSPDQQAATFQATQIVMNDIGANRDFRVESSGNEHMLFVDASANTVFIGGATTGQNVIHLDAGRIVLDKTNDWNIESGGSSNGLHFRVRHSNADVGFITSTSTGVSYLTTSDRRLKKNIKTITDATDKLMAMNPVTHGWKTDPEADTVHGFIAQEMLHIVPEAVSGDPEGEDMMSMDYGRITPVIVAALQDALKEIKELKTRINKLENK